MTVVIYMTGLGGVNVSERTVIELLLIHLEDVVGRAQMFEMYKKNMIHLNKWVFLSFPVARLYYLIILGFVENCT